MIPHGSAPPAGARQLTCAPTCGPSNAQCRIWGRGRTHRGRHRALCRGPLRHFEPNLPPLPRTRGFWGAGGDKAPTSDSPSPPPPHTALPIPRAALGPPAVTPRPPPPPPRPCDEPDSVQLRPGDHWAPARLRRGGPDGPTRYPRDVSNVRLGRGSGARLIEYQVQEHLHQRCGGAHGVGPVDVRVTDGSAVQCPHQRGKESGKGDPWARGVCEWQVLGSQGRADEGLRDRGYRLKQATKPQVRIVLGGRGFGGRFVFPIQS